MESVAEMMNNERRDILVRALGLGGLALLSPESLATALHADAPHRTPTAPNALGPFYKRAAPHRSILRRPGDHGLPLVITGTVYSVSGPRLPAATIDIWQANAAGFYDTVGNRYRATLQTGSAAQYEVHTVAPGHYPARVCQHVHFIVRADGHRTLVTEMYFATDPVFEGDPAKNYTRDPILTNRNLVRPVTLSGKPGAIEADVRFDLVLETA